MKKLMKVIISCSLAVLLGACGYQLKGAVQLDAAYQQTYLNHAISQPLYRPLSVALSDQGIKLVSQASEATAQLVIIKDQLLKQVQSIGVNNRVQEYRLDYEVTFMVRFLDRVQVPEQTLNLSRDFAFDIGQITGAQAEEQILREQMHKDMAQMIIRAIANQQ